MTALGTAPKTWLQLRNLNQQMPEIGTSHEVMVAISLSIVIHLFTALIFYIVATNRITVEPEASSIGTPLFVSLTTLTDTSNYRLDREEDSVVAYIDSPAQNSHSSLERKSEEETVLRSKDSSVPASDTPEDNSLVTDTTPLFKVEVPYRMDWDFEKVSGFKAEGIETSIGKRVPGSRASEGNSLSYYLTPSYGLDAVNRFDQVFGEMAESEFQRKKIKWRVEYIKKYEASLPPDCNFAYTNKGLLSIPYLIRDAITGNGCKW